MGDSCLQIRDRFRSSAGQNGGSTDGKCHRTIIHETTQCLVRVQDTALHKPTRVRDGTRERGPRTWVVRCKPVVRDAGPAQQSRSATTTLGRIQYIIYE